MTATSASSSCLPAKGLDISLAALQRQDPYINNIVDLASQVALYTYNNRANEWEKTDVEGTLFIYTRLASPRHGFTIMNRLSMENLTEPITKDLDFQLQHPFLLYRNARLVIHGIWFYDKEDCQRIAQKMKILTQQEQALAHSQGGWLSPGGGRGGVFGGGGGGGGGGLVGGLVGGVESEAKSVDIIQMLTKARTEYDKSTSEPKEIGGSSVLCGNPNLIKPIPVKPHTQDNEGAEPKPLSLATLFGSKPQHHHSPKPNPVSALVAPAPVAGHMTRPPVARTLTYEQAVANSGRNVPSNVAAGQDGRHSAMVRGQTVEGEGGKVAGLLPSPTAPHQQQPQPCPAIQKLMQGQRGVGVPAIGVLQTVSESPENRLCDNGVPLEHHLHHHLFHQQQQHQQLHHHHHHHHHHQQEQHLQPDPIKRLFQNQQLPPSSALLPSAPPLRCSNPPHPPLPPQQNPHLAPQPVMLDPVARSHLQAQQNQQSFFNLPKPQAEAQHNSQSASAVHGAGLLPSQVTDDKILQPSQGVSSQMPGVVSPHELLQKLQLVQQEQILASHDAPRPSPGLAPRFLGSIQGPGAGPVPTTAAQKAALQFQVISPQRIPATVAPNLLLSPSVFSQANPNVGMTAQENCSASSTLPRPLLQEKNTVLSRSQLQATLLHLIQTDTSFLDTIYEAYVSRSADATKY
ncbi:uncharacterized protein V6R79_001709 [Siganus canaliculatus]